MTNTIPTYTLSDGLTVPVVGFGTDKLKGAKGVSSIKQALQNGYRFIDTAYSYENEATVGKAVKESGLNRSEILISSKLPEKYHQYDLAIPAIQESLYRAGLDYYDLYLIHWPDPEQDKYVEAWQALIDAQKFGLIRSIGVSNFHPEHLDRLKAETGIVPVINQIQTHPYYIQDKLIDGNNAHAIQTQSWSPLGNRMADDLLDNQTIKSIAENYNKSIGQTILRWQVQSGFMPIPCSSSSSHQKENLHLFDFELSDNEMHTISNLSKPDGDIYGG
ncbi:Aldo/keto reductase [Alkalibacterium putridalgicola]|uniref:2,5-diketo-D-gluconic acid reductase n=1 Tax=Alkalibacterium putridalgicola TaxID=426703 RepID=A0A1H7VY16_9LACT|nr:2,5-diketo-D-gluconic acid reductase [Alkalibacterium putridalgicola]SEM14156.1 Aldo/keto reductase [Alkalibacterium putridalgicola]